MPPRNLNVLLIAVTVSVLCHVTHRRTRPALLVGDALDLIERYYVDPVDQQSLVRAALDGMTDELDRNSGYIPMDAFANLQDSINQEFAGIGIYIEQPEESEPVRIVTPLVGSPALEAGLKPGDEIVAVNGQDVSDAELREVSGRLKGPIGTTVDLTVRRGEKETPITVRRATIELESVTGDRRDADNEWVYRLEDAPGIAYVRLISFGEKTVGELGDVLVELDNDFDGLVLDLRGNSGGLLDAAVSVCDMILDSGRIVSTEARGGVVDATYVAQPGTLVDPDKPIAVLIDNDSASASEIVAACLQDHGRAVIVGTRSYGKGTVQNILPLQYGRSALRLTVARYVRPSGENIHRSEDAADGDQWGVRPGPGFRVELDEETVAKLIERWQKASFPMLGFPDSSANGAQSAEGKATHPAEGMEWPAGGPILELDPQLRRAVEYLREQADRGAEAVTAA